VIVTSVQAFTPFSGPSPATSSAQGSAAGPVKVKTLVDLLESRPFGHGRPTKDSRRKNVWDRLGGKASDTFGSIPQGELPPPLVGSPGSPPVVTARSQVPRPWFSSTTSRGGARGLTSVGVRPRHQPWRCPSRHHLWRLSFRRLWWRFALR